MVEHLTPVHTKRISNSITVFFYTGPGIPSYQAKERCLLKAFCFSSDFVGNLQWVSAVSSEVAFTTAVRTVLLRKTEPAVPVCLVLESDKISCPPAVVSTEGTGVSLCLLDPGEREAKWHVTCLWTTLSTRDLRGNSYTGSSMSNPAEVNSKYHFSLGIFFFKKKLITLNLT